MIIAKPKDPRRPSLRGALPVALLVGVVVLTQISFDMTAVQQGMPLLAGAFIFYWGLYRPDLVPHAVCLLVGLLQDILSGTPLGIHALGFILLRQMAAGQQQFLHGRAFHLVWFFFGFAFGLWALIEWFMMSILGYPFGMAPMLRYVSTVLSFPLVYALAGRFQYRFLRRGGH
ncbi:MAG: rod shape-determining protein MreD [Proteobacteria bacterium]|nr:rod shape-determining protein MreD [Pseudomonadota bacterium]